MDNFDSISHTAGLRVRFIALPFSQKLGRKLNEFAVSVTCSNPAALNYFTSVIVTLNLFKFRPHDGAREMVKDFMSQYPPVQSVDLEDMAMVSQYGAPGATIVTFGDVQIDAPGDYCFMVSLTGATVQSGYRWQVLLEKIETGTICVRS